MASIAQRLNSAVDISEINGLLQKVDSMVEANTSREVYQRCFRSIDMTSLGAMDSVKSIRSMVCKIKDFAQPVASVCVYPPFIETVGLELGDSEINITGVCGGFPSSQTFIEVKMLECSMAVENGADEVDLVMNLGAFCDGEYGYVLSELSLIREELGEDTVMKVIIESGMLEDPTQIRLASLIAMEAGADFVKTSTGKSEVSATPEAAIVMCRAIADYYKETGRKVGFKAAGGITTPADAVLYYTIVEQILGAEWLNPQLFRIGASSLAGNLLPMI